MKLTLKQPLKRFQINQKFGENFNNFYTSMGMLGHNGIDFYALDSTEIYASHDGRVTYAGYDGAGGLTIVIRTTEEFEDTEGKLSYWKTIYCHLKKDTIKVTGGQTVKVGDLIALSDNTGRSTGAHLHWGLKPIEKGEEDWMWFNLLSTNGYNGAVDPMPYLDLIASFLTLRRGDKGDMVKDMQAKLNTKLNYDIIVDGDFGAKTEKAVRNFQVQTGLTADGICGRRTWEKLNGLNL